MAKGTEIWVCPQCGFRMDIAPLGLYAEVQCPRCFYTDRVHAQLGNFRLDAVLGVGGMSVVYRAFDVVLHRALALKVLNDTFRDQPERIERFENESAMMARVRHENVTSVYSAGRAYGQFYIAMELIEGVNLEYMVTADKPMDPQQALEIIKQVSSGLRAASDAGLLHRDMKPGNVLITTGGQAKVIDFGLAMDSRQDDTEEIIWATPYYVPPETLERKPEDVRTDIYALGMTLRFLLTGVERFEEPADSLQTLIRCKRKLLPLAKQNSEIDPALCDLVDHMTEFSPADRPKDYNELIEEIEEVQQELLSVSASSSPSYRRRHSFIKSGGLVGAFVLGALLGLCFVPKNGAEKRQLLPIEPIKQGGQTDEYMPQILGLLEKKDYALAVSELLAFSARETNPCMGAWCAQLARILLGSCVNDPDSADKAHRLLLQHLANGSQVLPSGEKAFRMLSQMDTRRYPNAQDWSDGSSEWNSTTKPMLIKAINDLEQSDLHPVIKTMEWYVLSEMAIWLGYTELSETCRSKLKQIPSLGEYEALSEILSSPSIHKRASGSRSERTRAEASMREHDFDTAMERFAAIARDNRSGEKARSQAQVLYEVCEVGKAMLDLLKRRFPTVLRSDRSMEELVKLAKGLSPATRPAIWASSSQNANPPDDAIDGNVQSRWCASSAISGQKFVLDIDELEELKSIIFTWENEGDLSIKATIYSGGRAYAFDFTKNKASSRLELGNRVVDRIELTFNNTSLGRWASLAEVQLVTKDDRILSPAGTVGKNDFADELQAVLLMLNGQYAEAFAQMDFVVARQGAQSRFAAIARDWKKRWMDER